MAKKQPIVSTAPKGPPSYRPKQKPIHPIEVAFAADPFDPRFYEAGADRRLTPLGQLVQTFWYIRQQLMVSAPDAVKFLEKFDEQSHAPAEAQDRDA